MTKTRDADGEPFTLRYGPLEAMLSGLMDVSGKAIVTRFRKLRPKFAADGLLTDTGNRVDYDLSRILAICAIYELNALSIPQGNAVRIVVANWPEVSRACLAAWRGATEPVADRHDARSPIVRIYIEGLEASADEGSWASLETVAAPGLPHLALDCRPTVEALYAVATGSGQTDRLARGFRELDRTFGWDTTDDGDPPRLPRRPESDFFGTGPYFERARILLAADPASPLGRRRLTRLQAALDYLETPAPVDGWKRFLGTDAAKPRLVHMLAAWGVGLGLRSETIGQSETLRLASLDRAAAIKLIERGEQRMADIARSAHSS